MAREIFVVLLFLVAAGSGKLQNEFLEESEEPYESPAERYSAKHAEGEDSRVYGGTVANNPQAIFIARITTYFSNKTMIKECGGTIISSTMILTAAWCLVDKFGTEVYNVNITVGNFVTGDTQEVKVGAYRIHSNFSWNILYSDIAILNLTKPITFSGQFQPYTLPSKGKFGGMSKIDSLAGQYIKVYGWGTDIDISPGPGGNIDIEGDPNCPVTVKLPAALDAGGRRRREVEGRSKRQIPQYDVVEMKVLTQKVCRKKLREVFYDMPSTHTCSDTMRGTVGICGIDIGSPVLLSHRSGNVPILVGIVSHYEACPTYYPNTFTWLGLYLDWIAANGGPKAPK